MSVFASNLSGQSAKGPAVTGFRLRMPPFGKWFSVARERRQLGRLTDAQLRDIGVDPTGASIEAARPFWDLPKGR